MKGEYYTKLMLDLPPNYPSRGSGWCSTDRVCCWDEWFQQGTTALVVFVLRSSGPSPLMLPAMGTVQKLLSALAHILFKMDKDQLPLTSESHQEACNPQQIPAESLLIASQVLPGVQKKVLTSGLFHHLSLSVSMCQVSGEKKVRWLCGHGCQTARTQFKEQEQTAACFL